MVTTLMSAAKLVAARCTPAQSEASSRMRAAEVGLEMAKELFSCGLANEIQEG